MRRVILLDTGPLVALLDRSETEHARVAKLVAGLEAPFLTSEPVLTETCFLLRQVKNGPQTVLRMVRDGLLVVGLSVTSEAEALESLMKRYANVPMSLADACLVRLAEKNTHAVVLTFDSDFQVYRAKGHRPISVIGLR